MEIFQRKNNLSKNEFIKLTRIQEILNGYREALIHKETEAAMVKKHQKYNTLISINI